MNNFSKADGKAHQQDETSVLDKAEHEKRATGQMPPTESQPDDGSALNK